MKKLKKLLATMSAVVMCAISITPFVSNAKAGEWIYAPDQTVTPYATAFTVNGEKYVLWQEASDYFYNMNVESEPFDDNGHLTCFRGSEVNVFISEKPVKDEILDEVTGEVIGYRDHYGLYGYATTYWGIGENIKANSQVGPLYIENGYYFKNEEDMETLKSYLSDNNIPYEIDGNAVYIDNLGEEATIYDQMKIYIDIKENTGFVLNWGLLEEVVKIESVENALPEKTLDGDANEDGLVDIADATAIIQHIGNPDKYALTLQGEVNADCHNTGDGITGNDALEIQQRTLAKGMPE